MRKYLPKCPHTKELKCERGDFYTEKGVDYYRVIDTITKILPCGTTAYDVINEAVFANDSGIDPLGVEVRCKGCGKTYYVFPRR